MPSGSSAICHFDSVPIFRGLLPLLNPATIALRMSAPATVVAAEGLGEENVVEGDQSIAGSIGDGSIGVLQPSCAKRANLDIALGLQLWWCERFTKLGRQALSTLMKFKRPDGSDMISTEVPDRGDELVAEVLRSTVGMRWALSSRFVPDGARSELSARLFEKRESTSHRLGEWKLAGESVELPAQAFEVLVGTGLKIGIDKKDATWALT